MNPEAEATFNFTDNWGFCLESKVTVKKKPKGNFSLYMGENLISPTTGASASSPR